MADLKTIQTMNLDHPTMHDTSASGTVAAVITPADVSLNSVSVFGAEAGISADGLADHSADAFLIAASCAT